MGQTKYFKDCVVIAQARVIEGKKTPPHICTIVWDLIDNNFIRITFPFSLKETPLKRWKRFSFLGDKENLSASNSSRRDFLKFLGFSTAAATLAACETPVVKSIPYLVKPDEIIPGVANYYASTYYDGRDYASILVKTREGRPIKIENNGTSSNARVQASVLSLYDSARLKGPLKNNSETEWGIIDQEIKQRLSEISDGKIALLTSTILSPSTKEIIKTTHPAIGSVSYTHLTLPTKA